MGDQVKHSVNQALALFFGPMARWLIKAGISCRDVQELLRLAYVEEAKRSLPDGVNPENVTLISTRTGLGRAQVRQILAGVRRQGRAAERGGHRGERALAAWWHDRDFRDRLGRPRILKISKGRASFAELCQRHGGERQYPMILKDLEQAGAVRVLPGDRVQVLRRNYAAVGWTEAGMTAMGEQLGEHLETLLHNLLNPAEAEQLVCRRVVNPQVKPEYAKILARDLTSQLNAQFETFSDALTDPLHTVSDASETAEHISVTSYITRKRDTPAAPVQETSPPRQVGSQARRRPRQRQRNEERS
jgi:hypothetical protein